MVTVGNTPDSDGTEPAAGSFNTYYHFETGDTGFTAYLQFQYNEACKYFIPPSYHPSIEILIDLPFLLYSA